MKLVQNKVPRAAFLNLRHFKMRELQLPESLSQHRELNPHFLKLLRLRNINLDHTELDLKQLQWLLVL